MYILPHFDVDFQILLLIKYNELGSMVIVLTVEVSHQYTILEISHLLSVMLMA